MKRVGVIGSMVAGRIKLQKQAESMAGALTWAAGRVEKKRGDLCCRPQPDVGALARGVHICAGLHVRTLLRRWRLCDTSWTCQIKAAAALEKGG